MRILFLSSGPQVPSSRFRILPFARLLAQDGHRCTVAHSFPQKYDYFPWMGFRPSQLLKRSVRWWHWLRTKLTRYDIVYIDREIFDDPAHETELRFRESCRRMVVDFDDAVFLRYPDKFEHLVRQADLVVCGNRFLEERVTDVTDAEPRTLIIPTCVDMDRYQQRPPMTEAGVPVVGWMGTSGNLQYLSQAAEAICRVAADIDFRLLLVVPDTSALTAMNLSGVAIDHEQWSEHTEIAQLHGMDIGLMPLRSGEDWARYKCGAKLLQYLAVGTPGIASPVGVNGDIIGDNQHGFCADSVEEWEAALRALLGDHELRQQMGTAGRSFVKQNYSVQSQYPILRDALTRLTMED